MVIILHFWFGKFKFRASKTRKNKLENKYQPITCVPLNSLHHNNNNILKYTNTIINNFYKFTQFTPCI